MLKLAQNTSISTEPIYKFQNEHSVDFDGVDDFIQLGHGFTYTQHTVSAWIKLGEISRTHTILSGRDSSTDLIRFWVASSDNKVRFRLGDGSNTTVTNPTALEADRWYHVVGTYDGKDLKIYVDSVLGHSLAASKNVNVTDNLKIGEDDSSNRFMGNIDELAIWDRALTQAEITEIYRIKYGANLIQNGRFDELGSELVSNTNFTMGADLIQNGSLDELGSELIPDGNFTSQSAVDFWSIATTDSEPRATKSLQDGFMRLTFVNVGTPPAANGSALFKSGIVTSGKSYRVTFRAKGTASVNFGSIGDNNSISSNPQYVISNPNLTTSFQDYEFYVPVTSTTFRLYLTGSIEAGQTLDITNISVKQVDPNDRWSLDTGWAYSNNGVTCSSGNGTFQTNGLTLTDATFHKLTFDIVNYESGNLKVDLGNSATDATFTSAGSKTIFMNSGGFRRPRFYGGAFRGTISNITVQEISGWNVSQYRGFAINTDGHLEINSSLVEDTGSITYASLSLPSSPFVVGKTYKVVITDLNVTSGAFELKYGRVHNSTPARPVITSADNGTYVEYFEAVNTADDITINNLGGTLATLSSISIKQVDPNNRWNDIDGKFTFVNNGGKLSGNSSGLARLYAQNPSSLTSAGKTYKVSYTVVENNGTSLQHYDGDSYETITSTVGDHSFTYTRQGSNNNFILRNASGDSAFIVLTNIMLQEQKYVATNLKLNKGNYKSADPVIVSTKSVDFDGSDAYLDAGNVGAVKTLSFWFNPDSDITEDSPSTRLFGFSGTSYIGISIGNSTSMLVGEVLTVLPTGNSRTGTTHTFDAGRWYHVAVVWNETQEYYDIFINGVARTDLNTGTGVNSNFDSFLIGTANDTANYFNGQIDEVAIFNTSLTSSQIVEIYNQGVPARLEGDVTGHWKMGDGTLDEAPLIADQTNATLSSQLLDLTTGSASSPTFWNVASSTVLNYLGGSFSLNYYETGFTVTEGLIYKITLTISNYTGTLDLGWSSTGGIPSIMRLSGNGTVSTFFVATGNNGLRIFGRNTNTATLTVSLNQVNGNPALMINTPTIVTDAPLTKIRNYYRMGDGILDFFMSQTGSSSTTLTDGVICDMIEPSLGSELVINGDFSIAVGEPNAGWGTGSGWTIDTSNNRAVRDAEQTGNSQIYQTIAVEQDKVYRIEYTREYLSGGGQTNLFSDFIEDDTNTTRGRFVNTETNKLFTVVTYFQPQYTGNFILQVYGISTFSGIITNVSMKEVNGVAGLMQNMTESSITNDVPS